MPSRRNTEYTVRLLLPGEEGPLAEQVTLWRSRRNLAREVTQPLLEALRREREIVVLVDNDQDTIVGCLQLDRGNPAAASPPHTEAQAPALKLVTMATDPGAGYRLGWLLTLWARHHAALCGYRRLVSEIPVRHHTSPVGRKLFPYLLDRCGWSTTGPTRAANHSSAWVNPLETAAATHPSLAAMVTDEVPHAPAWQDTSA
ncbi:hypothetical protein [Streptomyces sp. NPDC091278]|uniref:hypothetical protein n=1 Tax=Streptomyces sp. NPDC091278 TaxID=3155301 RepID=UPI00344D6F55